MAVGVWVAVGVSVGVRVCVGVAVWVGVALFVGVICPGGLGPGTTPHPAKPAVTMHIPANAVAMFVRESIASDGLPSFRYGLTQLRGCHWTLA